MRISCSTKHLGPVSWRPTTVKWRQFSQPNHHSIICTGQTEYHEALPSSTNVQSHLTSSFADNGNTSWYLVCQVPMVEWWLDRENCHYLTVVSLQDTGPWSVCTILVHSQSSDNTTPHKTMMTLKGTNLDFTLYSFVPQTDPNTCSQRNRTTHETHVSQTQYWHWTHFNDRKQGYTVHTWFHADLTVHTWFI